MQDRPPRLVGIAVAVASLFFVGGCGDDETEPHTDASTSFFVTSATNATGNLGGLAGADRRCQDLAEAVKIGGRTWRAYLSVERDPDTDGPTHARDRIGHGPWKNAKGAVVAEDLDELHARKADHEIFVDESSRRINGFWPDSPSPPEHDIMTGSTMEGTVLEGFTCNGWTSASDDHKGQVGHSDGLDDHGVSRDPLWSWSSAHSNRGCSDTGPGGGAGRIYCFAAD